MAHRKFSSLYVKANHNWEKRELNLLLWAVSSLSSYGPGVCVLRGGAVCGERSFSSRRVFSGWDNLQNARWLLGESATNHLGTVIDKPA